jgi:hypothetical protein
MLCVGAVLSAGHIQETCLALTQLYTTVGRVFTEGRTGPLKFAGFWCAHCINLLRLAAATCDARMGSLLWYISLLGYLRCTQHVDFSQIGCRVLVGQLATYVATVALHYRWMVI